MSRKRTFVVGIPLSCLLLVLVSLPPTTWAADDLVRARQLVARALRLESEGLQGERQKLLEQAVELAPDYGPARWHSGHVQRDGRWLTIQAAQEQAAEDDRLQRYWLLANAATQHVKDQQRLARWCDDQGLEDLAGMHWFRVHCQQPKNREAAERLGLVEHDGRFLAPPQIAAEQAFQAASKHWTPLLQSWKRAIQQGPEATREKTLHELRDVQQLAAIPFLVEQYAEDPQLAQEVVAILGSMPPLQTYGWLGLFAVHHNDESVRTAATGELVSQLGRVPQIRYGLLPWLLGQLQVPAEFNYYVSTVNSITCTIDVYGPTANYRNAASTPMMYRPLTAPGLAPARIFTPHRVSVQFINRMARVSDAVEAHNTLAKHHNARVFAVLKNVANKTLPDEPQQWWDWWNQENERVVDEYKPTVYRDERVLIVSMSCFVAGTPVWTETGPKPIELVKVGERVLSQDPESGELGYRFVLDTTIRPPSKTLRIQIGKDEIWSTRGHLFWVSGKGWQLAKHLEVGDLIHSVKGAYPVTAVHQGPNAEAHNLVVDQFNTYFVGEVPLLVHDNMPRRLTPTIVPGLVDEQQP